MNQRDIDILKKSRRKAQLKRLLQDTDYKVIKCYEAQLLGEELPYDLQAVVSERRAWRAELESIMADLSEKPE